MTKDELLAKLEERRKPNPVKTRMGTYRRTAYVWPTEQREPSAHSKKIGQRWMANERQRGDVEL